jgi:hypothetical protein
MRRLVVRCSRLAFFGHSILDELPIAYIQPRLGCSQPRCSSIFCGVARFLNQYRTYKDGALRGLFKNTAAVTDFQLFQDAEDYLRVVSKATGGKYHRSANKARRAGLLVKQIRPGSYARSLFEIRASKLRRSHGVVPEALGNGERPDTDVKTPPEPPSCREHWRIDWGLFSNIDERMYGFASAIRAGNVVLLDHMICHAGVLGTGGMKLLHFEVMSHLLRPLNPHVTGVEYLVHGAIEDGGTGAAAWRRYVHQRPHVIQMPPQNLNGLPSDFDAAMYLSLNPDVRAARIDPERHYLIHGMLEGRPYKGEIDSRWSAPSRSVRWARWR